MPKTKKILFFSNLTEDIYLKDIQWILEYQPTLLEEWTLFDNAAYFKLKNGSYVNYGKSSVLGYWCSSIFIDSLMDLENEELHYALCRLIEDDEQFKALIPTYSLREFYEYFNRIVDRAVGRFFE